MTTLLECLQSLPSDLVMIDLAAVRDAVAPVATHIANLRKDEDGYEVRKSKRYYGQIEITEIGIVGGPTIYRQTLAAH